MSHLTLVFLALGSAIVLAFVTAYLAYQLFKYKFLLKQQQQAPMNEKLSNIEMHQEVKKRLEETVSISPDEVLPCVHHPTQNSIGSCAICEGTFCSQCLKSHQNLTFCKNHLLLYTEGEWEEVANVHTNPERPESGIFLYELKKQHWSSQKIPSFIKTHYKIDVENDFIESFVVLYARKQDRDKFQVKLQ